LPAGAAGAAGLVCEGDAPVVTPGFALAPGFAGAAAGGGVGVVFWAVAGAGLFAVGDGPFG